MMPCIENLVTFLKYSDVRYHFILLPEYSIDASFSVLFGSEISTFFFQPMIKEHSNNLEQKSKGNTYIQKDNFW